MAKQDPSQTAPTAQAPPPHRIHVKEDVFQRGWDGRGFDEFGHALMPEVSVDFVIFGDGSTWGPGKNLEMKGYLRGEFDAYENIQAHKDNPACKANEQNPG